MYLYDLFIRIWFILYLDLLFYDVITGCVFVVDEGVIFPDFLANISCYKIHTCSGVD